MTSKEKREKQADEILTILTEKGEHGALGMDKDEAYKDQESNTIFIMPYFRGGEKLIDIAKDYCELAQKEGCLVKAVFNRYLPLEFSSEMTIEEAKNAVQQAHKSAIIGRITEDMQRLAEEVSEDDFDIANPAHRLADLRSRLADKTGLSNISLPSPLKKAEQKISETLFKRHTAQTLAHTKKSFAKAITELSALYEQTNIRLMEQDQFSDLQKRCQAYRRDLSPFIKENPIIAYGLRKTENAQSQALISGMIGAMRDAPELSQTFLPKITEKVSEDTSLANLTAENLVYYLKRNPRHAEDVMPLFEMMSQNPPKNFYPASLEKASARDFEDLNWKTKSYFHLAAALVRNDPDIIERVEFSVNKYIGSIPPLLKEVLSNKGDEYAQYRCHFESYKKAIDLSRDLKEASAILGHFSKGRSE